MPRTTFLGREMLGPEEASPEVPDDSPRRHEVRHRRDPDAARLDAALERLRGGKRQDMHVLIEQPATIDPGNGMRTGPRIHRVSRAQVRDLEGKGWRVIGVPEPTGPNPNEVVGVDADGHEVTARQVAEHELEHLAHDINRPVRPTGRQRLIDGEVVRELDGDPDITPNTPTGMRGGKHKP